MLVTIFFYIFIVSLCLFGIPNMFIMPYMLGKRFDVITVKHNIKLPSGFGFIPSNIARTTAYAINITLLPDPKKNAKFLNYYRKQFGNFYFREHASAWDKAQALYLVVTLFIVILSALIMVIGGGIQYFFTII